MLCPKTGYTKLYLKSTRSSSHILHFFLHLEAITSMPHVQKHSPPCRCQHVTVRLSLPETPSLPIAATSGIEGVLAVFARYFPDISRMFCQIFHLFTLSEKLGKHLSDLSIFSLLPLQKKKLVNATVLMEKTLGFLGNQFVLVNFFYHKTQLG